MEMPPELKNYLTILNRRGELNADVVVRNFTEVVDKYYTLLGQMENSTWHELGQVSITNNMLPEVGTWLDAIEGNLDVLSAACTGYNNFRELLISLEEMIIRYNFLADTDPMTEDVEREMAELKNSIENKKTYCFNQKNYLEGLTNQIGNITVDIKVPKGNNTEEIYELTLSTFIDEIKDSITKLAGLSDIEGYSQKDKRWANLPYIPETYANSACGPTALATILTYCLGLEVLPTDTGEFENNRLLTNEYGTKWYSAVITGWNFFVGSRVVDDITEESIKTELLEGHPIVYGIKYNEDGGHYIALTDIHGDVVTVKDPMGEIKEMTLEDLVKNKKPGVPFVSFNPRDDTVENYNDIVLLTQTNE